MHPAIASAALAMGLIPIVVHLIARRRYRPVVWAAMPFLMAAKGRSRRRVWLEQWLVMFMRMAVVILMGLAIARPYVPSLPFLPVRSTRMHRVVLIDNSLSMNARSEDGQTRFSLARQYAEQLVASFPRTDGVSLVTLAHPATAVIAREAYDQRFVRDRLVAIEPTQRAADTVGGLARSCEILDASETPAGNRAVYVISDLPCRAWIGEGCEKGFSHQRLSGRAEARGSVDASMPTMRAARRLADALADPAVDFNLVRVAPDSSENVAVTGLTSDSTLAAVSLPVRLVAEVTNFGASSARNLILQVRSDERIIRREPLPLIGPGGSATAGVPHVFSTPGTHSVEAKVIAASGDLLEEDNARYLSIDVRETIPVLLVDGRPGTTLLGGQAGYLATALAPKVSAHQSEWALPEVVQRPQSTLVETKVISVPEVEGEVLGDYDVVALCNVQRLSEAQWQYLERFVSQGGGLVVFGGDLLSAENYNRFGYTDGAGLLPCRWGEIPVSSRPGEPASEDESYTAFSPHALTHPIVAEFAEHADSGLFLARIDRHLSVEVDPGRGEVVLRYTDDEPALVASAFGQGRVVVCTTTANMDWTNLPAKGDYVSLMLNTVAHVSGRHGQHRNVLVGQSIIEPLTPLQSSLPLRVVTADGMVEGRLAPFEDGLALEYGPVERAGEYSMLLGSQTRSFVGNLDPAESYLAPADEQALRAALDRPVNLVTVADWRISPTDSRGLTMGRSNELATVALWGVLALLIVEMWSALWFGSRRTGVGGNGVDQHGMSPMRRNQQGTGVREARRRRVAPAARGQRS
ncbi:MAG: VWA domain-containing protein [Planctomycetota bacterium]